MLKKVGGDIFADLDRRVELTKKLVKELSVEFAELYVTHLIENIRNNKFGFTLSDVTLSNRIQRGVTSTTPLIDTGEYIKAIIQKGAEVRMAKGVHKGGLSYEELSNILEFGRKDKSVPAFPVWQMTYDEVQPIFTKRIKKRLKDLHK